MPYARRNLKKKGPRVKLSQNNGLRWRKGTAAKGPLHKVWDNHLTLRQNYEKIGLVTDVNHLDQVQPTENPLVQFVPQEVVKEEVLSFSTRDQMICRQLIEKYGDDYEAMARDIKKNPDQLTEGQLKRQIEKYKRFLTMYDEEIPEKKEIKETHPTKPKSEKKKKMMKEMNEEEDASLLE